MIYKNFIQTITILLVLIISIYNSINAQSLDNIKNQQPITISGYLSTNQVLNYIPTDSIGMLNYTSYYTGSLNFNIYGISIPLTYMYSNQQGNFSHPFNQYALHPSYKWIKTHIGYASLSLSPYTMNGHLFLGTGAEIDPPGIFRFKVFYGRLKKAVLYDSINVQQTPAYKRMGYGLKIGIEKDGDFIDFIFFKAKDCINNENIIPETVQILPEENVAMSVIINKSLFKNLTINAEFASSLLSKNIRTKKTNTQATLLKPVSWFMPSRSSTVNRNAFKANITYTQNRYSIGSSYERVEPDYRTLGAYYFNNNLENITLNISVNFLDNKISFSGNGGLQRDNLDNSKMNNNKRIVASGSVNIVPNENLNMNASYSNFTGYTNVKSTFEYINQTNPYQNWDTLNYRQISQNVNYTLSYQLISNDKQSQSAGLNLAWQTSNNSQANKTTEKSDFYNLNVSHMMALLAFDFNINSSLSYNYNQSNDSIINYTWGPNINFAKLFINKSVKTNFSCGYNTSATNNINTGNTWNFRFGASYTFKKQHSFNLSFLHQIRNNKGENIAAKSYSTSTLTFAYVYNFQIIKQKENNKQN